jgi:hypothetical protein
MTFGLYLLFTCFLLLGFGLWIRSLVVRRLKPERILADLNQEVRSLVAGINQAGDTNISLLEDRINRLTELVQLADRQIDAARIAVERLNESRIIVAETVPTRHDDDHVAAHVAATHLAATGEHLATSSEQSGKETAAVASDAIDANDETVDAGGEPDEPDRYDVEGERSPVQDDRQRVIALYRQGLSEDLIASRTGIAVGEVNLIISLQGKRLWH